MNYIDRQIAAVIAVLLQTIDNQRKKISLVFYILDRFLEKNGVPAIVGM